MTTPTNKTGDQLIAMINKTFGNTGNGKPVATYAADMEPVQFRTSGSLSFDFATGVGGLPTNRPVEVCGRESSGKTTFALLTARQWIDAEPERMVVFYDMEHKLTPSWMEQLVGPERMGNLIVVSPDSIEQCTEMYRKMVTTGGVSMAILDSIGGAPTDQVMDETRSAQKAASMGGNAKGVTGFARFASNLSAKYDCLTMGINQIRADTVSRHGNMLQTPGGHGWKHACVLRVELRPGDERYIEKRNGEDIQVGFDVKARIFKNHLGGEEGRTAQWRFFTSDNNIAPFGVDTNEECKRIATLVDVIQRAGAYYRHPLFPKGQLQGMKAVDDYLADNHDVRTQIVSEVLAALATDPSKAALVSPIEDGGEYTMQDSEADVPA